MTQNDIATPIPSLLGMDIIGAGKLTMDPYPGAIDLDIPGKYTPKGRL